MRAPYTYLTVHEKENTRASVVCHQSSHKITPHYLEIFFIRNNPVINSDLFFIFFSKRSCCWKSVLSGKRRIKSNIIFVTGMKGIAFNLNQNLEKKMGKMKSTVKLRLRFMMHWLFIFITKFDIIPRFRNKHYISVLNIIYT